MNKELQALKRLYEHLDAEDLSGDDYYINDADKDFNIIETALKRLEKIETTTHSVLREDISNKLKALEIIKDKIKIDFNDHYFGIKGNYYIIVNNDVLSAIKVDKEEYDLLKEVLL